MFYAGYVGIVFKQRLSQRIVWICSQNVAKKFQRVETERSLHALVLTRLQLSSEVLATSGAAVSKRFVVVI
jgi:hypothetical protein